MNSTPIFTIAALYAAALTGIRGQNYERATEGAACAYRGKNNTKCAFGHGISDELFNEAKAVDPYVNGSGAEALFHALEKRHGSFDLYGVTGYATVLTFTESLQSLHDSILDPNYRDRDGYVDLDTDFDVRPIRDTDGDDETLTWAGRPNTITQPTPVQPKETI